MKGYKMVNGKKTSYFHTELTDEAKQLLAANAGPKKLDASALAEMEASKAAAGGGSAWNSAKTFEEKDMTKWSKQRLEALVAQVRNAGCSRAASPQQSSATESFLRCWGSGQVEGPFEHDVAVRYRPPVSYAWKKCRLTHPLVAGDAAVHKGQEGGWRRVHPCYPWQEALSVRPQHHCDMGGALHSERWGFLSLQKSVRGRSNSPAQRTSRVRWHAGTSRRTAKGNTSAAPKSPQRMWRSSQMNASEQRGSRPRPHWGRCCRHS